MKAAAKKVTKKTEPSAASSKTSDKKSLVWQETKKGEQWTTDRIPEGECCTPRITRSGKNRDGSYSFFCYRDARAVAVRKDLPSAKAACEHPPADKPDTVLAYVTEHPGEVPPFLALTPEERRAVRAQYPFVAPAVSRVRAAEVRPDGGDDADPGTRRLRAQLAQEGSGSAGRAARAGAAAQPRPKREALAVAQGRLVLVNEANPKKPGSAAHGRWARLFAACAAGQTAAKYAADGGNLETLANAVARGHVRVEEK